VSSLLLLGGLGIGAAALADLLHVVAPALAHALAAALGFLHVHSHGGVAVPGLGAAWLAGASVVVKEWLYRATMKVAEDKKSAVLKSNAMHHRVDSLTGLAALASVAVANLWPGFAAADALAGLAIAAMVVRAGWANTGAALRELADSSVEEAVLDRVRAAAEGALAAGGKRGAFAVEEGSGPGESAVVRGVRAVRAGQNLIVDVEVVLEPRVSVAQAQRIEAAVRESVAGDVRGVRLVRVRFVPLDRGEGAPFEGEWVEAKEVGEGEKGRGSPKERTQ
jgi:divalent metal cation (Fe/Co/Zn/Cd) transporter